MTTQENTLIKGNTLVETETKVVPNFENEGVDIIEDSIEMGGSEDPSVFGYNKLSKEPAATGICKLVEESLISRSNKIPEEPSVSDSNKATKKPAGANSNKSAKGHPNLVAGLKCISVSQDAPSKDKSLSAYKDASTSGGKTYSASQKASRGGRSFSTCQDTSIGPKHSSAPRMTLIWNSVILLYPRMFRPSLERSLYPQEDQGSSLLLL